MASILSYQKGDGGESSDGDSSDGESSDGESSDGEGGCKMLTK